MSIDEPTTQARPAQAGLRPFDDARAIVRLFQCPQCSYPVQEPIILPCGQSICRRCLPSPHVRTNITYPQNAGRAEGFNCPWKDCGMEHSLADCGLDVTLNKITEVVKAQISYDASRETGMTIRLDEILHLRSVMDCNIDVMPRSRVFAGGRIAAAFTMADVGELHYQSELSFTPSSSDSEDVLKALDTATAERLTAIARNELECLVCYALIIDPLTTTCGHTFCRKCVARVLDHSTLCPVCRRPLLSMRPGVSTEPSNKRIANLIDALLADELAARIVTIQQEESLDDDTWMPLFPCTLAFPNMPTFLHIFEPRYRLMVRRCIENGSRKFGMMMYNAHHSSQGNLGRSQYMQYGTVLHISRVEAFPDGRSLLETHGQYRFKVVEASMVDGYHVGRIQRIDDIPLAEEEAAEALETSGPEPPSDDFEARINHMSTQALLRHGLDFIQQAHARSAHWLSERMLAAYGQPPNDPATFPFWVASVFPITDDEKYRLLPSTSVRERLKLTARWIKLIEDARCERERFMRYIRSLQTVNAENETARTPIPAPITEAATGSQESETWEMVDPSVTDENEESGPDGNEASRPNAPSNTQ